MRDFPYPMSVWICTPFSGRCTLTKPIFGKTVTHFLAKLPLAGPLIMKFPMLLKVLNTAIRWFMTRKAVLGSVSTIALLSCVGTSR